MRVLIVGVVSFMFLAGGARAQGIRVVNMVPSTLSNETNQDSEPDITVNPNDPDEIIATAFTPNPTGTLTAAPIYISQDGGDTWVLNNIVPSSNGMTGDITIGLSRNNVLYAGILFGGGGLDMRILRSNAYLGAGTMTQLLGRTNEDQPYARAHSPMGGARRDYDHVYVGHNDFGNSPQTASFEQSLDAATAAAPAGLGVLRLENRTPFGQDGPPIRQAIHPDGTIYAVYMQRTASAGSVRTGNVVVVRDDDWGQGANPHQDLTDPGDSVAGRIVANGVSWVWNTSSVFGQERLGDRATIAVDPTDNQIVYVGWADRPTGATGNTATLHVQRSTDGGANWLGDLLTIAGAISPQLAVNIRGDVGFLYQQVTGTGASERWETHFQQSTDGGATWSDFALADTPSSNPTATFLPYLGDYAGLTASGKDFCGVFSASNIPDNANFPNGVTYQRSANFTTNTLTDGTGATVAVSIDPFFFHIENLARDLDFYVRDWSDSATDNDNGVEPSTDPVFYNTSDVWNRRSNSSAGFDANDRPISEDPQISTLGDNFAFARVHRKNTGSGATVTLHFLKSEFGTGSNYQNAGTDPDPTLSFSAAEQAKTLGSGYPWTLTATTSSHTCLAVEISTADDPIVPPGLLGHAPGWPSTDLMVIYDNNKAQRNMGVYTDAGSASSITYWAVIHNAATFRRNFVLQVQPDERFAKLFQKVDVDIVGEGKFRRDDDRLVLLDMMPGENRWVGLTVPVGPRQEQGAQAGVSFAETVGNLPVNGFSIAVQRAPFEVAGIESLRLFSANLYRIGHLLRIQEAVALSKELLRPIQGEKIKPEAYGELVSSHHDRYRKWIQTAVAKEQADLFKLSEKLERLASAIRSKRPESILPEQSNVDHAVDALLTYLDKRQGDIADVAQNMRWQGDLIASVPKLREVEDADSLVKLSETFDREYASRKLTANDYPRFVKESLPILRRLNEVLGLGQYEALQQIEESLPNPSRLQQAHWAFLSQLEKTRDRKEEKTVPTDNSLVKAPYVFAGTVAGSPGADSYSVKVDNIYFQNGKFEDQTGKEVTVVDAAKALRDGQKYVFYTEPLMFGDVITVKLLEAKDGQDKDLRMKDAQQSFERETLRKRVQQAELVVSGTVTAVRAFDDATFESEHLPDFREAIVKVDRVLKGNAPEGELVFIFAASRDVHWFRAPKFKERDEGIFLLNSGTRDVASIKIDGKRFVLIDPGDFQPREQLKTIETLTK